MSGNIDTSNSKDYRDLQEIQRLLKQFENKAEKVLNYFDTQKDQLNFKPGRTNIDSVDEPGDPRRPELDG